LTAVDVVSCAWEARALGRERKLARVSPARRSADGSGLRLGVDARAAAEVPAGRGRYVRELLRAFRATDVPHTFVLYARQPWSEERLDDRFRWNLINAADPLWSALAAKRATHECDALLASNSYAMAALAACPGLAIVHDLVAFRRGVRPPRGSLFERMTLPLAVRRAAGLVCVSAATREALVKRYPSVASRAFVVHLGVERRFHDARPSDEIARRYDLGRPYVLATGTLEPRKNLPRLIEAFVRLPGHLRDSHTLVLVGGAGWASRQLARAIEGHTAQVIRLGHVPDVDLPALYAGARVFCYPSLYEGFGLPVLEAMAAGVPVVASSTSSLPEVGGEAVRYVDPLDVASIHAGLREVLEDPAYRERLARAGRVRAQDFPWGRTATRTLTLLEGIARRRRVT
jgi:glycosyltransferase involved in cell wall biosynthesis